MEGVKISIYSNKLRERLTTYTDNSGYYKICGIRESTYDMSHTFYYGKNKRSSRSPLRDDEINMIKGRMIQKDKILNIEDIDK
ncbi:MAG: hypothetical protein GY757_11555 [bacterium]|nr:hypothetical protein [bacterium]